MPAHVLCQYARKLINAADQREVIGGGGMAKLVNIRPQLVLSGF